MLVMATPVAGREASLALELRGEILGGREIQLSRHRHDALPGRLQHLLGLRHPARHQEGVRRQSRAAAEKGRQRGRGHGGAPHQRLNRIVGGGREFCVECWFDVSDTGKDSVFLQPEDSGYNTFYHYYQGSGMYIRCRWENSTARIVDHTELFLADLADDLNGITEDNHSGYDTFFDFYNDKEVRAVWVEDKATWQFRRAFV